jgi:putative ABC transport system permease protein
LTSHFPRLVLTVVGIAAAVAFISGIQVVTATLDRSVESVFTEIYGRTDVFVKGKAGANGTFDSAFGGSRSSVSEELVPAMRRVTEVAAAEGQVQEATSIFGPDGRPISDRSVPPTFGMNWLDSEALNGWRIADGEAPVAPDEVVIDLRTARDERLALGDRIGVLGVDGAVHDLTLVGTASFGDTDSYAGSTVVLTEASTAQRLFLAPRTFSWIAVVGRPGTSQPDLQRALYPVLPKEDRAVTQAAFTAEAQSTFLGYVAFLQRFLLAFAYVALFVGAYSIFNTFSIVVAQRQRELALLRALGASRSQVVTMVVLEAVAVGLVASVAGVAIGVAIGTWATSALTSSGLVSSSVGVQLPAGPLAGALGFGWGVTVVAALLPARRASRVKPIAAFRGEVSSAVRKDWVRLALGGVSIVAGLWSVGQGLRAPDASASLAKVSSGLAMAFVGLAFVSPLFWAPATRVLAIPVVRLLGTVGRLARDNAIRNPLRTSRVATSLIVGVGVLTMFSVMTSSLASTSATTFDQSVHADFVVHPDLARGGVVADEVERQLAQVDGVGVVGGFRFGGGELDNVGIVAVGIEPSSLASVLDVRVVAGSIEQMGNGGIAIQRSFAEANGWALGRELTGEFVSTGYEQVRVVALLEGATPFGVTAAFMPKDALDRRVPPRQRGDAIVLVQLDEATRAQRMEEARRAIAVVIADHPVLRVERVSEFAQAGVAPADTFLNVVTALLLVAMLIAFIGIANTLLLSVYERVPEIGVLRAVGMHRRQVRAMFRWEALFIAVLGAAIGLVVGVGAGWALARAAQDSDTLVVSVPWVRLAASAVAAAVLAVVAAVLPARRAARLDVLAAIAAD